jgi:hypothetical protein
VKVILWLVCEKIIGVGNGKLNIGRAGPTRGPAVVTREVVRRREMAAGEGTGRAGRPPLVTWK